MGLDYYGILNVKFDCDIFAIQEAFRRAVIKYYTTNKPMLCFCCEAYEVLSDPGYRALYNHFGEEGLKSGVLAQPYVFHGQPLRTVEKFFGTLNPVEFVFKRVYKYDTIQIKQVLLPTPLRIKDPPIHKELFLTLEEIFYGGHKNLLFYRQEYNVDKGMVTRDAALKVPIERGIFTGTKLIFKNEADQGPVNIPGDVIVTIKERPHKRFFRSGSNLIQRIPVTLKDAFLGMIFTIETIDNRKLRVRIYPPLSNYWNKTIDREGLPIPGESGKKGDLILSAEVKMPIKVTRAINEMLVAALDMAEEQGMYYEEPNVEENSEKDIDKNDPCNMKAEVVEVNECP